jgi:phage terminase large subunit-like protein
VKWELPTPDCPDPTWALPMWSTAGLPKPPGAYYCSSSAERAVRSIRLMRHSKGEWSGKPFELLPFQEWEIVRPIFGWKVAKCEPHPFSQLCTQPRLYRTAYIEGPKKFGKTTLAAGISGYMAFSDGENGAECFVYAADKDQARIAFEAISYGISYKGSPYEKKGIQVLKSSIENQRTKSFIKVMTSTANTKHGPSAAFVLIDELHAHKSRELWDVVSTGVAARRQPLVMATTTAGWDRNSICWEKREYTRQVAERIFEDKNFFGVIWSVPEDADWTKKETWYQAHPALGVTVKEDFYAQKAREAQQSPAFTNAFRQLHLSQWTNQAVRVIPLEAWDRNDAKPNVELLKSSRALCYGGLDLSSTTDLSALTLVFPGKDDEPTDLLVKYWMPAENLRERSLRDRVPYQQWVDQGFITATPGDVIDYDFIQSEILQAKNDYDLREISYDPWNAVQLVLQLQKERIKMVPMRQGFQSISPPLKELLRMILQTQLRHGGNPVLRWNADSCAAVTDAAENIKLDKVRSSARIDGMVATVMALDAMLRHPSSKRRSIYDDEPPPF